MKKTPCTLVAILYYTIHTSLLIVWSIRPYKKKIVHKNTLHCGLWVFFYIVSAQEGGTSLWQCATFTSPLLFFRQIWNVLICKTENSRSRSSTRSQDGGPRPEVTTNDYLFKKSRCQFRFWEIHPNIGKKPWSKMTRRSFSSHGNCLAIDHAIM